MKRNLLFAIVLSAIVQMEAGAQWMQPANNPVYTQGPGHGFFKGPDGLPRMITSTDPNAGSVNSHYTTKLNCSGDQIAMNVRNLAPTVNRCFNGYAEGKRPGIDTGWIHGNAISSATNQNLPFWYATDVAQNIFDPFESIKWTDADKANASFDGAVFFKDSIMIWYNSWLVAPHALNGVFLTQITTVSVTTGVVTQRPDLTLVSTGALAAKVTSISNTSGGELIILGSSTNIGSAAGPVAQNGYFYNLTTGNKTDVGMPGNGPTKAYGEVIGTGTGYFGNHATNLPAGMNVGLVKVNVTTHIKTSLPAYGILINDISVRGNEVIGGGNTFSFPVGGIIGILNTLTSTWGANIAPNSTLFNTVNSVSSVYKLETFECPLSITGYAILVAGNMGQLGQSSPYNYVAKYYPTPALAIRTLITAQRVGNDVKISWKEGVLGSTLERSYDGNTFSTLSQVNSETGSYNDHLGGGYYRIRHGNDLTKVVFVKHINMIQTDLLSDRYRITFMLDTRFAVYNSAGQVIQHGKARTIEVKFGGGLKVLSFEGYVKKLPW